MKKLKIKTEMLRRTGPALQFIHGQHYYSRLPITIRTVTPRITSDSLASYGDIEIC